MPSRVGKAFWLHCTGIGKALLAEKDDEALDALVTRTGLPARTPLTHTTAAALKADLAQVTARGYALDDEENEPGIRCVAAVIHDHTAYRDRRRQHLDACPSSSRSPRSP